MSIPKSRQRAPLLCIAREAMVARGFMPDFSPKALANAQALAAPR
jgi:hypothetical protein